MFGFVLVTRILVQSTHISSVIQDEVKKLTTGIRFPNIPKKRLISLNISPTPTQFQKALEFLKQPFMILGHHGPHCFQRPARKYDEPGNKRFRGGMFQID